MGTSYSSETISQRYDLKIEQFRPTVVLKSSLGHLQAVQNPQSHESFILKAISFDNDETFESLKRALEDLDRAQKEGQPCYLYVHGAEVSDKRLICSASTFMIVLDYFQMNLEDSIHANYLDYFFGHESRIWEFLFGLVRLIRFNDKNKIQGHFFHPRSICWIEQRQVWGLIHPAFFPDQNNYTEAMAGNLHFCSPEAFSQASSGHRQLYIADQDRSDMFSVGLMILYILYKAGPDFDMNKVYNRMQWAVDGLYLQRMVNSLDQMNVSDLLMRVIGDMVQELEHLRMSSTAFLDFLENQQQNLENENFQAHDKILDNYMELKSSHIIMSVNKEFIGKEESFKLTRRSTILGERKGSIDPSKKAVPLSKNNRAFD